MKLILGKACSLCLFVLIFIKFDLHAQNKNITLESRLTYNKDLSDIWGYVDSNGREFALVGVFDGFSVVEIDFPLGIREVYKHQGPETIWRDIKTWGNYAYVTNEGDSGLLIVDMSGASANDFNFPSKYYKGENYPFKTAHNLFIDDLGRVYIFGADYLKGGAIILDVSQDPWNPSEIGLFDDFYFHDGVAYDSILYGSAIYEGFQTIIDVSNPQQPNVLNTFLTPGFFTHNNWVSDDRKHIFTTDEVNGGVVAAYDISNVNMVRKLAEVKPSSTIETVPHNTHYHNGFIITSWYSEGIRIHDAKYPEFLLETGFYDTSPRFVSGFNGCWGAYPWLPSGRILATDIQEGLFVLNPNYRHGAYLNGLVIDKATGNSVFNALIQLLRPGQANLDIYGDFNGKFKFGSLDTGDLALIVVADGYESSFVQGLKLQSDSVLEIVVEMNREGYNFGYEDIDLNSNNFAVFPNPLNNGNVLRIGDENEILTQSLWVYNSFGSKVGMLKKLNENIFEIPENLSNGLYFIITDEGRSAKLLIHR